MAIIEVDALRKTYGRGPGPGRRPAVDGISFSVEEGEVFGILGANGAGKTTLVECVEGLRVPDSGTIEVAGFDPVAQHDEVTRILGAQLQESELPAKLTVREALALYCACYEAPADWRPLAERLGLTGKLGARFGDLSAGQKQRLFIALALVGNPRVVVLDELTTGLDPRARRDTWELIEDVRRGGVTVLLVTHFMEEAQRLCDRIAVIDKGRIAALDTPSGLIRRAAGSTVISFTPSSPLDERVLAALAAAPQATAMTQEHGRFTLHGTDDTVNAVITLLARHHVTAHQLRVSEATLDDAFLDLTEAQA
ncbi:ABC transporter ATP-binding protein [Streptomyces sp. NPDC059917]|uniref:ABC transporter ATP-binding protein n=1 Tax=Streptomyces sp. NPDC059917 TaxID=3347002 RepID=UPI00365CE1FD